MIHKNTKVVCTIGPASDTVEILEKLIHAGMNVARLNFSHGDYKHFALVIKNIRTASKNLDIPIAIMQDLQGPKIRVGELPEEGIMLKKDSTIILTIKKINGFSKNGETVIPVQYKGLPKDVRKEDKILLCDGMIELTVLQVKGENIRCKVITPGLLESHKGINVPTASISANPITDKDKKDLEFGIKQNVDFIAMSFVRNAKNIMELRELIRHLHGRAKIIAKVERHEAIRNMEEIIHEADGVMVARGDMGVEIPPEQVPLVQKRLIRMANRHGKPVITATEMLQSMITNSRATRAEVSDVANAIFDNTDAIMLSNESAVGKYPIKATLTLSKVAASIEHEMKKHGQIHLGNIFEENQPISYATCEATAELAKNIGAKMIVAITMSGFTAEHIAKHRPYVPIIAITEDTKVQFQLQLIWGINRVFVHKIDLRNMQKDIRKLLTENHLVHPRDQVVIVYNASQDEKLISTIII